MNLSGRGDKDVHTVEKSIVTSRIGPPEFRTFAAPSRRTAYRAWSPTPPPAIRICARSAEILKALDRAGADVLEVGVPFSDPLADGPVIQRATERALAAGGNLRAALAMIETVRPHVAAPIVVFSYANPLLRMGAGRLCAASRGGGRRRRARARSAD